MAFSNPKTYSRMSEQQQQPVHQMAARRRTSGSSEAEEDRLDFEQAMEDFRRMFPSLDMEVIEAVLRSNNGAVDDTVDQLLVMTMEDEPSPTRSKSKEKKTTVQGETLPKSIDDTPESPQQMYLNLPRGWARATLPAASDPRVTPAMSSTTTSTSSIFDSTYLAQNQRRPIENIPEPDSISPDLLLNEFLGPPPAYSKVVEESRQEKKKKKKYNPPLLGPLPDNFLKFTEDYSLDVIYDDLARRKESERKSHKAVGRRRSPDFEPFTGGGMGIFRTSGPPRKHQHKGLEHADTWSGLSARRRKQYKETAKQAEKLKEMMTDNQFRRQLSNDPELEQYLEDERVAIMLQNREFMKELRRNKDFMNALERDAAFVEEERMMKKAKKLSLKEKKSSGSGASKVPSSPRLSVDTPFQPPSPPPEKYEVIDSPSREESVLDGYGEEEPVSADAFPYTKPLPKADEGEVAFREKLKFMGRTSRQKFALMARKFASKRKGAKGMFGTSDSHHSNVMLLNATDDYEYSGEDPALQAGYNQPEADDEYNIGQKRDLKEGRLFSK